MKKKLQAAKAASLVRGLHPAALWKSGTKGKIILLLILTLVILVATGVIDMALAKVLIDALVNFL